MDRRRRSQDRLHRARQPLGERLLRELQLQASRRAAERRDVLQPRRGEDRHRELAAALQYPAPALEPRLQAAGAVRHAVAGGAASISHGRQADHALDLNRATKWGQATRRRRIPRRSLLPEPGCRAAPAHRRNRVVNPQVHEHDAAPSGAKRSLRSRHRVTESAKEFGRYRSPSSLLRSSPGRPTVAGFPEKGGSVLRAQERGRLASTHSSETGPRGISQEFVRLGLRYGGGDIDTFTLLKMHHRFAASGYDPAGCAPPV